MSNKRKQIPTLLPETSDSFHFGNDAWHVGLAASSLFHINRLEDYRDKILFPLPPHRKTESDFLFLTNGKSVRSKGLNEYTISKNQFFFLPALHITAHKMMSKDVKGFFFKFHDDLFSSAALLQKLKDFPFLKFDANPLVTIPEGQLSPILNILQRLESLYFGEKDNDLVVWYLLALLAEVNRHVKTDQKLKMNSAALLTSEYKTALMKHIYEWHTVQQFAEILFVTPNHLNKCVKQTLNKTAQSLLNEMLILEAKSLLKYSDLSISQIAEKLFKRTPSNFARFFKSQTGISPKQYVDS